MAMTQFLRRPIPGSAIPGCSAAQADGRFPDISPEELYAQVCEAAFSSGDFLTIRTDAGLAATAARRR
jgi:hypothetical protein